MAWFLNLSLLPGNLKVTTMNVYKVIFANNEVISCVDISNNMVLGDLYHYEHDKGKLIYAIIKAESEIEAGRIAAQLVKEVTEQVFGNDFIT
jgi:hypothetical protein